MKNDIREILGKRRIILDGGTGTLLAAKGLRPDQSPEDWNTERPEEIYAAARGYLDAGSDVICANTFGCGPLRHADYEKLVKAAAETARKAADNAQKEDGRKRYVALDIGPTGKLMRPSGDLSFDGAYDAFSRLVRAGAPYCDLVLI
ncbi:MAG: homocysteine S-methyltransferase family protein, partial [Clostridia bacterium]|nr:homocysteine S-methyltransferase family protein [Clostridia bacterium]